MYTRIHGYYWPFLRGHHLYMYFCRVGPIYPLADIFGRYRYRHIGIGKLDIGIGHIGIGNGIGYSGYRLYRYWPNIGPPLVPVEIILICL